MGAGHSRTAHSGLIVDIIAAHGEVNGIELCRAVELEPHQPDGAHQVGHSVGLGEHILDLAAGLDVPVRHLVLPHGFLPAGLEAALGHLALTDRLHDIKGHLGLQPLAQQVEHDAVTAADDLRDGAGAAADQLVGVAGPDIGAVGQARDLDQLREVPGPGLHQHSAHEVGAHFRDAEGAGLAVDLFRGHAQLLRAGEQAVHPGVVHGDAVHGDAGVLLKILVEGGHIVAQLVQLEQGVVEVLELEMRREQTARHIIRRVLDGAEIVDLVGIGHNHHAAGVLSGGALDTGAAQGQAVLLGVVDGPAAGLQILFDVAVGGLVLNAGHCTRLEHIGLAEQLLGVAVDVGLILAREVQVDIRLLVSVEAQEGLKGDVVAVHQHPGAAVGAVLIGQVEAVVHAAVGDELTVLALGAAVVGRQAVDLRNPREVGHGGGAHRATAAHLIAARVGVGHQLDGNDVQNSVAVAADGVQLLFQAVLHDLGQGVAVIPPGVFPGGVAQLLLRALDAGRVGAAGDGPHVVVDGGRDLAGVGHHDLVGLFLGQVAELLQHILRGAVEQRGLGVRILEAVARLQHRAVDGILRLGKMHVAGGDDRFVQVLAQPDDGAVEVLDDLLALHLAVPHHILVVAQGLDLQHVVVGGDFLQFLVGAPLHNGTVKLARLTGAGQDQAVAVLVQQAAGHTGLLEEVVDVGLAHDLVQVLQAHLVLDQNDEVEVLLFQHLPVAAQTGVDALHGGDLFLGKVTEHDAEDAAQRGGVLAGAVGLVVGQLQMLVDGSLLIVVQARIHSLCHGQGVDIGRLKGNAAALGGGFQEADIERMGIVGHQDAAIREPEKGFQRFLLPGGIGHHLVGDAGQLSDLGGDGLARLDKGVELLHHFPVPHDHRADLGQVLHAGVQAGGLGVEHAELAVQRLVLHAVDAGHHIIHKVGLAAVDQLEIRVALVDLVGGQHGLRVALTDTVVGDGNGRVAHPVGQLDDAARVAEGIHAGQLGMQVKLHPLFRGVVLPLFPFHEQDIVGVNNVVVLVLVVGAVAAHQQGGALGDVLPLGAVLPFLRADLQVDGAGVIGDGHRVDLAVVALDLGKEHVAPDHALAALAAQVLEGGEVLWGEHLAVENGHGLVGQIKALHLDGGGGVLFLELDHRRGDLALQLFLHLALFGLAHRACQGNFGPDTGVGGNTIRQQALKLHLLQKLGAVADPHRDVLAGDGNPAPVQKAVDGDAVPLHLLHQLPQGGFVQRGIAEEVVDLQFKALIIRLQGGQQPGAQPLVQRGGTAQGKNDLPLLPQHPGMLHDHAPETGREIRVRHELRP